MDRLEDAPDPTRNAPTFRFPIWLIYADPVEAATRYYLPEDDRKPVLIALGAACDSMLALQDCAGAAPSLQPHFSLLRSVRAKCAHRVQKID
jgi:hypothetical protein